MRWITFAEWEASGGKSFDEPTTFVYIKHKTHGGLRVLSQWDVVAQEWVCDYDSSLSSLTEYDGWKVTHILEVSHPE